MVWDELYSTHSYTSFFLLVLELSHTEHSLSLTYSFCHFIKKNAVQIRKSGKENRKGERKRKEGENPVLSTEVLESEEN